MLDLDADITGLRGADYNPRKISEADLASLARSIETLGLVKPLIVRGDLLVAGHQRTRALRSLGVTRAAVYRLDSATTVYDEVRFNQLHNGTGLDAGDEAARIDGGFPALGWHVIDPSRVRANFRGKLAGVRDEIAVLINRYGPWGGVVATRQGEVIHAAQYALSAFLTHSPLTVHVLDDDKIPYARAALGVDYGVFDYSGIERHTYIQTLAQMTRLRESSTLDKKSRLYDGFVIPAAEASPTTRFLDFGSGHADYAKAMRRRGFHFDDVELFRRIAGANAIDSRSVHAMIDKLCASLAVGPYDAVVCDAVLNSVDSAQAEGAVMTTLNALTKLGGRIFISGRPRERLVDNTRETKRNPQHHRRLVEFVDQDGFTALFRAGHWFFQRYHGKAEVQPLCERFGFRVDVHKHGNGAWQAVATKVRQLPADEVRAALRFEFNQPLGDGVSLGRAEDVIRAVELHPSRRPAA